jgi:uncharacterized tellurite resistance protein B-like protein
LFPQISRALDFGQISNRTSMLDSLIRMIKRPQAGSMRPGSVEIAAAALIVEMARFDTDLKPEERAAISDIVRGRFLLSPPAADALVALAERREEESYSDWAFAETVKSAFDLDERRKLLRHIHLVATTDSVLAKSQTDIVARLAEIVAIPPEDVGVLATKSAPPPKRARSVASS